MTGNGQAALHAACAAAGLDAAGAEPVRMGENAIWRLPGLVIARVARPGQLAAAAREVQVGAWLAANDIPAVQPLSLDQPIDVEGRAVTFWRELPPHRNGTPTEVARALRRLHALAPPADIALGHLDPFVRLGDRIEAATTLTEDDRAWLRQQAHTLAQRYRELPAGRAHCVVHGDAWAGNVVATTAGDVVFVDLERLSIGPPEWDLVSTAVKHHSLGGITGPDYQAYCHAYGTDVTDWAGYELLRDIRELRMATYVAQLGADRPDAAAEAQHRLRCLLARNGPRPWAWTAY